MVFSNLVLAIKLMRTELCKFRPPASHPILWNRGTWLAGSTGRGQFDDFPSSGIFMLSHVGLQLWTDPP